jgi:hypothetical protein
MRITYLHPVGTRNSFMAQYLKRKQSAWSCSDCVSSYSTLLELALEDHRNIPIKIWEHKSNIKMW